MALALLVASVPAGTIPTPALAGSGKTALTQAPRFSLPGRAGETVALDSLRAKVVLVDFWASWCVPCHKSFPWMNTLHERYAAKGLAIVAINLDKDRARADAFLAKAPAAFPVAFDPGGATALAFKVSAMPTSYLVAPDGTILLRHLGFDPTSTAAIEERIEEACAR